MEDKLMDILKDRIDERVSEAVSDASVNHITAVMSELGCTPERAMDLLHIPESERPTCVTLAFFLLARYLPSHAVTETISDASTDTWPPHGCLQSRGQIV